jgi:hypothetical protein
MLKLQPLPISQSGIIPKHVQSLLLLETMRTYFMTHCKEHARSLWENISPKTPPQVRRRYDTSQGHFVRQYDVDQLLGMLSYHELRYLVSSQNILPRTPMYALCAKPTLAGHCAKTQHFFSRMTNNGANPNLQ